VSARFEQRAGVGLAKERKWIQNTDTYLNAALSLRARFPRLAVRQWVLSLPKRLRYFLRHDRRTVAVALAMLRRVVAQVLRQRAAGAVPKARRGAVSFVHHFGSALNDHCPSIVVSSTVHSSRTREAVRQYVSEKS